MVVIFLKISSMIFKSFPLIAFLLVFFSISGFAQNFLSTWENLPGPDGGSILQFETDGDMLYALTLGGIYESRNAGEDWDLLQGSRNVANFSAQLEAEAGVLYVLTGGVLSRSRDMGKTWKILLQEPYPLDSMERPKGIFVNKDTLISITSTAIYQSENQGNTWQKSTVPDNFFVQRFKSFAKVGTDIFVAFDSFILKSEDGGLTWKQNFKSSNSFADMEVIDSVLYALYDGYPRLIRSYDHGIHWDKIDADSIQFGQYYSGARDWITGTGDTIFYSSEYGCIHGGVQMFRSFNEGEDWSGSPRNGFRDHWMQDLKALSPHLLAGTMQGVFRSQDNATSFHPFHKGMNGTWVHSLFKMPNGRWWINTRQGIFSSDDDGGTWELQFAGELEEPCGWWWNTLHKTSKRLYRNECDLYCHVWMSEDGGSTWVEIPPIHQFWSADITSSEETIWVIEHSRLYKLADTESSFSEVALPAQGNPYDLKVFGDKLLISIERDLYLSENQGVTWEKIPGQSQELQQVGTPIYMDNEAIFALSEPFDDSLLVFDFVQKVWEPYFPIVEGDTLNYWEFQFLKTVGDLRWMSAKGRGLYYSSTTEPQKWYPFVPLLPYNTATAIAFDFLSDEMWVGTAGAGVYKTRFQLGKATSGSLGFVIYPNPSIGESTLSSQTFFSEKIILRVFDVSGKMLREDSLPPGQSWDINLSLPNGLYVWQIITPFGPVALKWLRTN